MRRWYWFAIQLGALCVLFAIGADSVWRTSRALARLELADELRRSLDGLVMALDDAENAERGYVATSDPTFLERYRRASKVWPEAMVQVRRVGDGAQVQKLDGIESIASRKLDLLSKTIADHDANAAQSEIAEDMLAVMPVTDDLRRATSDVQSSAEGLARRRVESAKTRAGWVVIAFCAVVVSFILGSAWVVSQRRRDEEQRKRAEERAALLDITDEFVAVLGHDLRNPLGVVLMAAKLLRGRSLADQDGKIVGRIINSAERMQRMIDELLDLARSRLGPGIPVVRTRSDLRDIVANTVDELRTRYPQREIHWDWRGDGSGSWDQDRMAQMIGNLLGNAIEHGDPDSVVDVQLEGVGSKIALAVHNFGAPIPEDAMPTLFAFYKRPARTDSNGLGLGLFIADQICRAHGGTLSVRSSADEGTTFTSVFERAT